MERISVSNRFGPPVALVVEEIPPTQLTETFRLLRDVEPELMACYTVCFEHGGYRFAEVVSYGCPEGIMLRLILTGPGMRKDLWERLLPAEATVGEMVRAYWGDPAVLTGRG